MNTAEMEELLLPYAQPSMVLLEQLRVYLELLVRWNTRTNLTSIRDEREIVQRHFGESLFAGSLVPVHAHSLLDFGSGAGFPGLPIQLAHPKICVTLAESQGKKAAFLREAVRVLGVGTEVWAGRVEKMPEARRFDVVTVRAVDRPRVALEEARRRVAKGGMVLSLLGAASGLGSAVAMPGMGHGVVEVIAS